MRRFFIEEIRESEGICIIPEPEAKHIVKVLRMGKGDRLLLMDSKGANFEAVIESVSRRELTAKLIKKLPETPLSPVSIDICQAVIKPRVMDYMIEKTSELGVAKITPFYSERSVIRLEKERVRQKMKHWTEVSRSAAKQSGRTSPADISEPLLLREVLSNYKKKEGLKVVLWEGENNNSIKEVIKSSSANTHFTGVVGPEGGFSVNEIKGFKDAGFIPVSLGRRILRAETAAITLAAVIQYEWGDLGMTAIDTQGK